MSCPAYRDRELGRLDTERFDRHVETCPECRKLVQEDARLMESVKSMSRHIDATDLWNRIEQQLRNEQKRRALRRERFQSPLARAAVAAALILSVIYGLWRAGVWTSDEAPPLITKSRSFVYRLAPTSAQRLYIDAPRIEIEITGHIRNEMDVAAEVTAQATVEAEADARLAQAGLLVQPYQDYIRVGLNLPPDSTVTGRLRIHAPADMPMYIGNQNGAIRLIGVHGQIEVNAENSPVDIRGLRQFPPDTRLRIAAAGKPVMLALPENADALVTAATDYGVIDSDFPLYYLDEYHRRANLYLGGNDMRIEINVTNADIEILKEK